MDDWAGRQAGFRTDWSAAANALTLQGDLFDNPTEGGSISGGNLLARWGRRLGSGSALEVQAYYDEVERLSTGATDSLETFDLEAQHSRSEEHTSELQSLMRTSYAVFCLKKKKRRV